MIIWNRLDLARRDVTFFPCDFHDEMFPLILWSSLLCYFQDEKDAIRSLDLLYRRVEVIVSLDCFLCYKIFKLTPFFKEDNQIVLERLR